MAEVAGLNINRLQFNLTMQSTLIFDMASVEGISDFNLIYNI